MANTLTDLIPDLYTSLDTVSRELVGFIPSVSMDATFERAAKGQAVRSPVTQAQTASDITPDVTAPDDGDQTIDNVSLTISKSRRVPVRWNGEQTRGTNNNGPGQQTLLQQQFSQAMRTLVNEVESDLAATHLSASRANGTAGTIPFQTTDDFTDASETLKVLKDNGAPLQDNQMLIDTSAAAKMIGKQARVDAAGDDSILRQGILLDIHGFAIRESAQVENFTAGTADSATTDSAGYAKGATTINLAVAGTGEIKPGDFVQFAGDPNQYMVLVGDTDVSDGGSIELQKPGLRQAIPSSATAITVTGDSTRNMAFNRGAIQLATRAPALPEGGDSADDRMTVTDPRSGISFEVSMYRQYRQVQYEVALAWGSQVIKPEHTAVLLG